MDPSKDITIKYAERHVKEPGAAGLIYIETKAAYPAGHPFYTDWIDTGLGSGHHELVFYQIDDRGMDNVPFENNRLLYGDASVFEHSSYVIGVPLLSLGAFLDETTGKFQLGAVLKTSMPLPGRFVIGWRAHREVLRNEKEEQLLNVSAFRIENTPTSIKPGHKYVFRCICPSEHRENLKWQVMGEETGIIDNNGMYTAPERQGIFEVRAYVPDTSFETSVYVVVKA